MDKIPFPASQSESSACAASHQRRIIQITQRTLDAQAANRDGPIRVIAQHPTTVILLRIMLHVTLILVNDQVFAETRNRPVKFKLLPAIVPFSRRRKYLDDQQRIKNHILLIAEKLEFSANHGAIGVSVQPSRGDLDPHIGAKDTTPCRHLGVKQRTDTRGEQRMVRRPARHREHPPIVKLTLEFSLTLDLKILVLSKRRVRQSG